MGDGRLKTGDGGRMTGKTKITIDPSTLYCEEKFYALLRFPVRSCSNDIVNLYAIKLLLKGTIGHTDYGYAHGFLGRVRDSVRFCALMGLSLKY